MKIEGERKTIYNRRGRIYKRRYEGRGRGEERGESERERGGKVPKTMS